MAGQYIVSLPDGKEAILDVSLVKEGVSVSIDKIGTPFLSLHYGLIPAQELADLLISHSD